MGPKIFYGTNLILAFFTKTAKNARFKKVKGSVAEWFKAPVSKTGMPKCIGGSNPPASEIERSEIEETSKATACLAWRIRKGGVYRNESMGQSEIRRLYRTCKVRILPLPKLNEVKLRRRARQLLVLRGGFEKAEYPTGSPGDKVKHDAYPNPAGFDPPPFQN